MDPVKLIKVDVIASEVSRAVFAVPRGVPSRNRALVLFLTIRLSLDKKRDYPGRETKRR